jgi:excisionase family DNA binding protein
MTEEWLTVQEAAELSGYHPNYIRQIIRAGRVRARKFATVWQVSRSDLRVYLRKTENLGAKRGPKRRD